MFDPQVVQGRWLGQEDLELIRRLIAEHPQWSRRRVSVAVSEALNWRTASGQLKDMSARLLLAKLAERGLIQLPLRQRRGGRQKLRALQELDLFWAARREQEPIEGPLKGLIPLQVELAEAGTEVALDFVRYLAEHHYLGFEGASGQNLRYLIRDRYGRDLACLLFGSAAWKVKARDSFIGWSAEERARRLGLITNNSRFLILPHVRVTNLASHLLSLILKRLRGDWQRKYQLAPALAETFVERQRFSGACYRAANWQLVGQTCGRTRHDRFNTVQVPIKDIYLYALCPDFRKRLCT